MSGTGRADRRDRRARPPLVRVWWWRPPFLPDLLNVLRRQLQGLAARWALTEDETFRLLMVVNELVSNVIDHARTPFRVTVRLTGTVLRVLVTDHCAAAPQLQTHDQAVPAGHGLHLVDDLAAQWGWTGHRRGKTVWASITHRYPDHARG